LVVGIPCGVQTDGSFVVLQSLLVHLELHVAVPSDVEVFGRWLLSNLEHLGIEFQCLCELPFVEVSMTKISVSLVLQRPVFDSLAVVTDCLIELFEEHETVAAEIEVFTIA
jgi:hypothetical protein